MDEKAMLKFGLDFARGRTLDLLKSVEALGPELSAKALAWRPGPGRAHIGWQLMHIAATDDRYLAVRIKNTTPTDPDFCARYAGGSVPADETVNPADIRNRLEKYRAALLSFVAGIDPSNLDEKPFPDSPRTLRESLVLLAWHEGHHQGQAHITLNLFKAAHAVK
jgi:uncharacterized damage-inducible protein DinB